MNKQKFLEFNSKYCKNGIHPQCYGKWTGLGYEVICNCICHKKMMLDENRSLSNTINSPQVKSGEYEYTW
ncbi:MAG: hypothetical protein ACRD6U_06680 [Nitrososphaeraceae archaeon]